MELKPHELDSHLSRQLLPVYLVCGDEPLQQAEALDHLRIAAKKAGFLNRIVLHVEGSFDWNQLLGACLTQSLFAEKNLIELNMPTGKPGIAGSKALLKALENLSNDNLLIIQTGKLDKNTKLSKWCKAIEQQGAVVTVWPLRQHELTGWIKNRLLKQGVNVEHDVPALLANLIEGNLLAAVQEIEKLHVLYGEQRIGQQEVLSSLSDHSRFDVFKLSEAMLKGDVQRVLHILSGLKAEKLATPLFLWVLVKDLRVLSSLAFAQQKRQNTAAVFKHHRVFQQTQRDYLMAVQRAPMAHWMRLLQCCAQIELMSKGAAQGDEQVLIEQVCLAVCQPDQFGYFSSVAV